MVAQVCRNEGIHSCRLGVVEQAVTRTTADRDRTKQGCRVAAIADACRCTWQRASHDAYEIDQRRRLLQRPYTTEPRRAVESGQVVDVNGGFLVRVCCPQRRNGGRNEPSRHRHLETVLLSGGSLADGSDHRVRTRLRCEGASTPDRPRAPDVVADRSGSYAGEGLGY